MKSNEEKKVGNKKMDTQKWKFKLRFVWDQVRDYEFIFLWFLNWKVQNKKNPIFP